MSERDEDAQTFSDFYEAFGPKTPQEKAAIVWRLSEVIVICDDETKS